MDEQIINIGLYIAYGLMVVASLSVVVGLVLGLMHDFKSGIFTLGALGLMVIIFLIAFSVSSAELTPKLITKGFTESHMKLFAGGLFTFYVLFALAWGALIYDLVKNLIQGN